MMADQFTAAKEQATFVVLGGGIAGVTCAEVLSSMSPDDRIILISASPLVKAVTNFKQVSRALEIFDVKEVSADSLKTECGNVDVIQGLVVSLDSDKHLVKTNSGLTVGYKKLCICTGGKPKLIYEDNPFVLGIRDTDSVQIFQKKLSNARRVVVVGNGGIATELVYELKGCDVVWLIKDDTISSLYLDPGAAQFLLPRLLENHHESTEGPLKRHKYTVSDNTSCVGDSTPGGALGPDWSERVALSGNKKEESSNNVHVEYEVQVKKIWSSEEYSQTNTQHMFADKGSNLNDVSDWPVYLELTNGKVYGCDLVVSATGVQPNTNHLHGNQFDIADDGGIMVDSHMKSSVKDVFAAGDVCTVNWETSPLWQQMRLWTQARQMGAYAAKCMVAEIQGETIQLDFCFELFAHVTKFFNHKVVLLGKYNGHNLGREFSVIVRVSEGKEYVKTVMHDGKMVGATLIGDTDLEETFENLILNQMDLSSFGEDLLHPGVDLEDFFD